MIPFDENDTPTVPSCNLIGAVQRMDVDETNTAETLVAPNQQ